MNGKITEKDIDDLINNNEYFSSLDIQDQIDVKNLLIVFHKQKGVYKEPIVTYRWYWISPQGKDGYSKRMTQKQYDDSYENKYGYKYERIESSRREK